MDYTSEQHDFEILLCLIEIWSVKDPTNPMEQSNDVRLITEVENIEISESYKNLISSAALSFPRGTVVRKTTTEMNVSQDAISTEEVGASTIDNGILVVKKTTTKLATVDDFSVGNRIRISLGKTTDPTIPTLAKIDSNKSSIFNDSSKLAKYKSYLAVMFDGYITQCSVDTPIEIECESITSCLKKITCPHIIVKNNITVNDLLSANGKYKLLDGTGIKLHPDTEGTEINLGALEISEDLTVADVLTTWSKRNKLYAYLKPGANNEPYLAVGRVYFSNPKKDNVMIETGMVPNILFDYNVAKNGLSVMRNDKMFLAVQASCVEKNGKIYNMTVRRNPEYTGKPSENEWQILNEVKLSKKDQQAGATVMSGAKNRVDLSKYTIIPYMSNKIGISHDELLQEAIQCYQGYNANGVSGTLTLFGDFNLRTGTKVRLTDKPYPQKNGYYLVDEVHTTFGVDGYRQTIKLPFLIAKIKDNDEQEDG